MVALNCEVKCIQKPSRVPGLCPGVGEVLPHRGEGQLWAAQVALARGVAEQEQQRHDEDDADAGRPEVRRVQPRWPSAQVIGIAATTAPSWPRVPVSWVTSGIRRAGNQLSPAAARR